MAKTAHERQCLKCRKPPSALGPTPSELVEFERLDATAPLDEEGSLTWSFEGEPLTARERRWLELYRKLGKPCFGALLDGTSGRIGQRMVISQCRHQCSVAQNGDDNAACYVGSVNPSADKSKGCSTPTNRPHRGGCFFHFSG